MLGKVNSLQVILFFSFHVKFILFLKMKILVAQLICSLCELGSIMEAFRDAQSRQCYNSDFSLNSHTVIRAMEVGGCVCKACAKDL